MLYLLLACTGGPILSWFEGSSSSTTQTHEALCEDYCGQMMSTCGHIYLTDSDCTEACMSMDVNGVEGDRDGDTVQCRQHALELELCDQAAADSPLCSDPEDGHTGQLPDDTAGPQ